MINENARQQIQSVKTQVDKMEEFKKRIIKKPESSILLLSAEQSILTAKQEIKKLETDLEIRLAGFDYFKDFVFTVEENEERFNNGSIF